MLRCVRRWWHRRHRCCAQVATGSVDGAFIDGDRNGFNTNNVDKCGGAKVAAYEAGLNASVAALAQNLSASDR